MLGYMAAFFDNLRGWTTGLAQTTSSATGSTLSLDDITRVQGDYIANSQAAAYAGGFGLTATEVQMRQRYRDAQMARLGRAEEPQVPREVWELMRDSSTLRTDERNGNYTLSQYGQVLWRYIGRDRRWVKGEEKHMDDDWSPADKAYTIALFMADRGWFKWNRGPIEFARLVNQLHAEYVDGE